MIVSLRPAENAAQMSILLGTAGTRFLSIAIRLDMFLVIALKAVNVVFARTCLTMRLITPIPGTSDLSLKKLEPPNVQLSMMSVIPLLLMMIAFPLQIFHLTKCRLLMPTLLSLRVTLHTGRFWILRDLWYPPHPLSLLYLGSLWF